MKQMWKKVVAFTLASAVVLGAMPVNIGPGGLFGGTAIVARAESIIVDFNEVTISTDTTCDYDFYVHCGGLVIDQGVTLMFESGCSYFQVYDNAYIELHGTMAGDISDWERAECYDNSYIHVYLSDGAKYKVTGLYCYDDDCIRYYGYDAATDGGGTVSVKDEDGETDVTPETIGYETTTYTYTAIPAKGYKFKNWTKGAGGEILDTEASIEVTCAQNGQYQVYANFEVDINSFNQSADVNPTITFGSDYVDNLTVTRDDGVIDLNGHAITGNVFLQNNNPDKTVTIKNGTITGEIDGAPAFNDFYKGKVVLENVTVGGTIWTDGHDYTISGGTYNGIIFALKNSETIGSTTITDGIFNGSLISGFGNPVVEGGTFSVSGGTFAYRPVAEFMANGYSAYWNEGKYTVSENNLNEVTSKIVNPSFENGTAGWEFKASDDSGSRDANNDIYRTLGSSGNWLFNTWGQGWNVHQTVTGLTNGKYRLTAVVASTGSVVLRANGVKSAAATTNNAAVGTLADVEFYVTDGTATIGAEGVDNVWFKCDDFRLFYIDASQPKPAETEENDYTNYIKNPDFEYGSGYGWTFDNSANANETGVFYAVSPYTVIGQSGNYIYNTWNNNVGYPISQIVTGLPNGRYRLSAALGPENNAFIKGNGQTSMLGAEGETAVEFEVTDGMAVIGAEGVNGSWFKVDNFKLTLIALATYEKSDILISQDITHGIVTADKVTAAEGEIVTLTVTPDEGYLVGSISVNDDAIEVTNNGDGTYSFEMPADDVTVMATFVSVNEVARAISVATAFMGKFQMNFYLYLPESLISDEGAYAMFTGGSADKKIMINSLTGTETEDGIKYKLSYDVYAKEARDTINLRLYYGNGEPVEVVSATGMKNYTETGIETTLLSYLDYCCGLSDEETVTLAEAAKNYCTAAQIYFDYKSEGLDFAEELDAVTEETLATYAAKITGTMPKGVTVDSISTIVEADNSFRLYLKYDGTVAPKKYKYYINDVAVKLKSSGGKYYLEVKNIGSNHLDDDIKFTITRGTKSCDVTVSVLTYARSCLLYGNGNVIKLAQALYLYNQAAVAKLGK